MLNAANEVAVHAFLDGEIGYPDIVATISEVLAGHQAGRSPTSTRRSSGIAGAAARHRGAFQAPAGAIVSGAPMLHLASNTAAFIFALGVIIFVHEAGHLLVAKAFGMKVLAFSLGFGKRLFGWKVGETDYRISLVPLGGYVKLSGEEPGESTDDPRDFLNQPRWQRILVYLAGPADERGALDPAHRRPVHGRHRGAGAAERAVGHRHGRSRTPRAPPPACCRATRSSPSTARR